MPDHQIVIKLDKDQFDEAQRLAKLAGFRSASTFIRERVVSIIKDGGEGNELETLIPNLPLKIKNIDSDLSRIQHELKMFISETDLTPIPVQSIVEKQNAPDTSFDSQLSFAEFSDQTGATIELNDPVYHTGKETSSSELVITDNTSVETKKELPVPDQNEHEKEKSVWQSGDKSTDTTLENMEIQPDASHKESAPEVKEAVEAAEIANDELEEMADRAFSISPRLGALDPNKGPIPLSDDDPLADLLDEHLVDKLITPAGMDFDPEPEPEPEPESEPEPEPESEPEPEIPATDSPKTETKPKKKKKKAKSDPEIKPESNESSSEPNKIEESDKAEEEADKNSDDSDEDVKKHDLSGGPPPKRRKK